MESLQETQILKRVAKLLSPFWLIGFLGIFSPFFYAFLPVHEADICLC